jgi:predicted DNA-binding protein
MTRVKGGDFIVRERKTVKTGYRFSKSFVEKLKNLARKLGLSDTETVEEAIELLDKKLRRKK